MSNYTAITATAQIKASAGKLNGIFVSSASSTPTITVYDSSASSASDPVVLAVAGAKSGLKCTVNATTTM